MTSENIWTRVRQQPFKPFRLRTSDGQHYDVLHPEMINLSKNRVTVNLYEKDETPGVDLASREVFISPLHVTSIEDVPAQRTKSRRSA